MLAITTDACDFILLNPLTFEIVHKGSITPELNCEEAKGMGRPTYRPFGIAEDGDYIYIASNSKIGKFDKLTYKLTDIVSNNLFINTHQILKSGDTMYVCNTSVDCIGIGSKYLNVNSLAIVEEAPTPRHVYDYDTRHVNTLFDDGESIWFCLHNRGNRLSEYGKINKETLEAEIVCSAGLCGHGIVVKDGFLYTLSTGSGELLEVDLETKRIKAYPLAGDNVFLRGLDMYNGKFIIGGSINFKHPNKEKNSIIFVVDLHNKTVKHHYIENIDFINDLKVINV